MTKNPMPLSTRQAVSESSACGLFQRRRFQFSLPAVEVHICAAARAGLDRIEIAAAHPAFCVFLQQLIPSFRNDVKPTGALRRGESRANGRQLRLVHRRNEPRYWWNAGIPNRWHGRRTV